MADILFISRNFEFNWEEIFKEAQKKINYIDPVEISIILIEFSSEFLDKILWAGEINKRDALKDIKMITKDILTKNVNSLNL